MGQRHRPHLLPVVVVVRGGAIGRDGDDCCNTIEAAAVAHSHARRYTPRTLRTNEEEAQQLQRARDAVDDIVAHALEDLARLEDGVDDDGEPLLSEHDVGGSAGGVGRPVHCDANVGTLEGGRIVDALRTGGGSAGRATESPSSGLSFPPPSPLLTSPVMPHTWPCLRMRSTIWNLCSGRTCGGRSQWVGRRELRRGREEAAGAPLRSRAPP